MHIRLDENANSQSPVPSQTMEPQFSPLAASHPMTISELYPKWYRVQRSNQNYVPNWFQVRLLRTPALSAAPGKRLPDSRFGLRNTE